MTTSAKAQQAELEARKRPDGKGVELRSHTRYRVQGLEASLGTFERSKVLNLSMGGAGIRTSQYIGLGKTLPFRVVGEAGRLRIQATVCWSRLVRTVTVGPGETKPVYLIGLKFARLTASEEKRLEKLIHASLAP